MKSSTVISFLSAVAGVFAAPAEEAHHGPVRRPVGGPFSKEKDGKFSTNYVESPWGGSVQEGQGWRTATGTTVIPRVTGQSPSAGAAAWVGIDGYHCSNAILQTGVVAWGDGTVQAWYEWWPYDPVYYGSRFPVKAGDTIRMSVNATSYNSGTSTLENLTTGNSVTTPYNNMGYSLCLSDAEWIIEFGGGATEFADFGTWDITNTAASGSSGQVSANGGYITNVVINNQQYTSCGTNANGMRCVWQ